MNTLKKTLSLAAIISATMAISSVATTAGATEAAKKEKAKKHHHHVTDRQLIRADERHIKADESRIANLEAEVGDLRAQLVTQKQSEDAVAAKQQQLEAQVAAEAAKENAKNNLVFFRGGYASLTSNRNDELLTGNTNAHPLLAPTSGNGNGWYVGAGMDFRASDDFFGLSDMVALDAELMFQYQNFGESYNNFVSSVVGHVVRNQVTMFTIAASPKVKFNLMDGKFRPWIIPFGLAIDVVSPPSSGVTVLNPGLQVGTGLEYNFLSNLWVGADFRYYFTGGDLNYRGGSNLNQTPTQGLVSGAYIGVGF